MAGEIVIGPVQPEQREVLDGWLDDARGFGIDLSDVESIGAAFDEYQLTVMEQEPEERADPTPFCTMIGMAMGEYLVQHSDLEWRLITDDEGTDLGLANPSETGVLFPADPVANAWQEQTFGWLPDWVSQLVASLRSDPA